MSGTIDWASDYDIFDPEYLENPFQVWDELRPTCPVAHTDRWGGSFLPTRYEDVAAIARDTTTYSSRTPIVVTLPKEFQGQNAYEGVTAPPISSDPPEHTWARRLILPVFAPKAVEKYEPFTREFCRNLITRFIERGTCDAAVEYAQQIPVRVIGQMLGIPVEMNDQFVDWVRGVLELGLTDPELRVRTRREMMTYFHGLIQERKANPGDDLISWLTQQEVNGEKVPDLHVLGTVGLMLVAGVDTTWSSIGSALWHLATHPEDRRRLVAEPEIMPLAIEEFLRAYSPVTMAREVTVDTEYDGVKIPAGSKVLMSFPAANRDPEQFPDPDKVIIDREHNRHVAFGVGIHRCAGSNLARMEMRIAVEEFLARIPEFELQDGAEVTWAGGQVRGPRLLPVRFPTR